MAGKIDLITYEHAGFPVELLDERDWRRAIRTRRLARSTQVAVYRGASPPRREAAESVPELRLLFDELDPISRTGPISGPSSPEAQPPGAPFRDVVDEVPLAGDEADTTIWDPRGPEQREPTYQPSGILGPEETNLPEQVADSDSSTATIGAVVVLVLVVLGFIAVIGGGEGTTPPVEAVSQAQTYRVKEPANARNGPTTDAPRMRTLRRNTVLVGSTVDDALGRTWIRVSEGEHAGLYVWTGNLEVAGGSGAGIDKR